VLEEYASKHDFRLTTAEALVVDGTPVSATRIRQALAAGDMEEAARMLGRLPSASGQVVEGDKRGRQIGFPTANLKLPHRRAIPADGVYVAWSDVLGARRPSVVNIGLRPTFDLKERLIESHLLDFEGDLYGQEMTLEFLHRLRGEQKFAGIDAIREQIGRDAQAAREYFTTL
jgi:riboflavin kinase/FMN adenylyltransferase